MTFCNVFLFHHPFFLTSSSNIFYLQRLPMPTSRLPKFSSNVCYFQRLLLPNVLFQCLFQKFSSTILASSSSSNAFFFERLLQTYYSSIVIKQRPLFPTPTSANGFFQHPFLSTSSAKSPCNVSTQSFLLPTCYPPNVLFIHRLLPKSVASNIYTFQHPHLLPYSPKVFFERSLLPRSSHSYALFFKRLLQTSYPSNFVFFQRLLCHSIIIPISSFSVFCLSFLIFFSFFFFNVSVFQHILFRCFFSFSLNFSFFKNILLTIFL